MSDYLLNMLVKTCGSESQGKEEAACMHTSLQAYATTTVSYLHARAAVKL